MTKQLDVGHSNPRLQCAACGRWKRLHGRDKAGNGVQRFYGGCNVTGGDHPFDGDVCSDCCPTKCANKIGCDCQNPTPTNRGAAGVSESCPIHGQLISTATTVL